MRVTLGSLAGHTTPALWPGASCPGEEELSAGSCSTETRRVGPRKAPPGGCEGGGDRGLRRGLAVWLRPQSFSRGWRPLSAGSVRSVWCPLPSGCHQVLNPRWPFPQGRSLSYRCRLAVTLGGEASAGILWARPGVLALSSCRAEPPHRTRFCPRRGTLVPCGPFTFVPDNLKFS